MRRVRKEEVSVDDASSFMNLLESLRFWGETEGNSRYFRFIGGVLGISCKKAINSS
ncbi:MAG: hypothetical protein K0R67_2279 [Paenibacillus sp.]|nr:hypothetical protein [Paenibacillus sp.]